MLDVNELPISIHENVNTMLGTTWTRAKRWPTHGHVNTQDSDHYTRESRNFVTTPQSITLRL